jgi:phosphate/sulfate permease
MEQIYFAILLILFLLAFSDLVVGVSNDAVNFLVSAIGSKAGSFRLVMIIASLGVIVGATFSSGMMEIARKGIFIPEKFYFTEVMIIFVAVMLTDIILLDIFNTFGLPTSTTVSVVFELIGGSVIVAFFKMAPSENLLDYINTGKAVAIIVGIVGAVIIAFTIGAIVQYISRIIFTFQYDRSLKWVGAIWAGVAVTAITYYILVKGLKGSSFVTDDVSEWIHVNGMLISLISFAAWTVIMQILLWMRINILKIVVLIGTFGLAMSFAGNDLVNFIGVPLAGLDSWHIAHASGVTDWNTLTMVGLQAPSKTPTLYLLIAGLVMVLTLWLSKKAKKVTETSINLSRQSEDGVEQFDSSYVGRVVVRMSIAFASYVDNFVPDKVKSFVNERLARPDGVEESKEKGAAFDLIRATVNLSVASIIISLGTSKTMPLSTTFVTFMVAMGSSLADGAWGRSTAVYRVTGVLSVITGWFLTAIVAFSITGVFAMLMYLISPLMVFPILAFVIYVVWQLRKYLKNKEDAFQNTEEVEVVNIVNNTGDLVEASKLSVAKTVMTHVVKGLTDESRHEMKEARKLAKKINKRSKELKENIAQTVATLEANQIETGYYYAQMIDFMREIAHSSEYISKPSFEHLDNNLNRLSDLQLEDLSKVIASFSKLTNAALNLLDGAIFKETENLGLIEKEITDQIRLFRLNHFAKIKKSKSNAKSSTLYLNLLTEMQNTSRFTVNLMLSTHDFVVNRQSKK